MSAVAVDKIPQAEKDQLAVSYAAFVLSSVGASVNAESLDKVIKAAGLKPNTELITVVAKTLKNKSVSDFYSVGAPTGEEAPAAAAPAKKDEKKPEPKKEEKKAAPPPPPVEDEPDMGGLFD